MKRFGELINENNEENELMDRIREELDQREIKDRMDLMNFYADMRDEGIDGILVFKVIESHPKCKGIWDTWN